VAHVGIERDGQRLVETREIIAFWARYVMDKVFADPRPPSPLGIQNMLTVCAMIGPPR